MVLNLVARLLTGAGAAGGLGVVRAGVGAADGDVDGDAEGVALTEGEGDPVSSASTGVEPVTVTRPAAGTWRCSSADPPTSTRPTASAAATVPRIGARRTPTWCALPGAATRPGADRKQPCGPDLAGAFSSSSERLI